MSRGPLHVSGGVRCQGLTKHFRIRGWLPGRPREMVPALKGIDLRVGEGSIHGIIGPNGSGKSTLLRILATLVLPNSGSVFLDDLDVVGDPLGARQRIGFTTGEERSLYWRLTARQNLEFYASLYRLPNPRERINQVLERLDLSAVADRAVSGYSQGMLRRLGLARAILHQPSVLLLDEPARSLDPLARERFHHLVVDMRNQQGTTVLLATHDLAEASEICDTVTILNRGVVAGEVSPGDPASLRLLLAEAGT